MNKRFVYNPRLLKNTIHVACVGDSITYGYTLLPRRKKCYPTKLQKMLGKRYLVGNFGVTGATLQTHGNKPYSKSRNFKYSTQFLPHIVILMLGTNDSKMINWRGVDAFRCDYLDLIAHYRSLPSCAQIYLMTPATSYLQDTVNPFPSTISESVIEEITKEVLQIATEQKLPCIDIHELTHAHPEYFLLDGIHPNANGALAIAKEVYLALRH
ncbi:MAG: GDSL-type esterase/lipase family protein [Lachnospiraceae bacterium]